MKWVHTRAADTLSGTSWPVTFTDYEFPFSGKGTISLTFKTDQTFRIVLGSEKNLDGMLLVLEVNLKKTALCRDNGTDAAGVIAETSAKKALLDSGTKISYWMSLDYLNVRVRFGKGQMLPLAAWACTPLPVALAHLLWLLPVVLTPPLVLVPSDRITLEMIARNEATVFASLPEACQVLYGNVAGPDIKLDTPDFRDFSAAINYSIITPG
ncbi:MAG: hypothetical protein BYD32DRAFT_438899 [Podila humilis]|nr:MAG: hypothetical protein BYD32DRAFT_438899 [Podila humilis]